MKMSIDIPKALVDKLRRTAVVRNASVNLLVREVLSDGLKAVVVDQGDPEQRRAARMKWVGKIRHLRKETARINAIVEKEFERD